MWGSVVAGLFVPPDPAPPGMTQAQLGNIFQHVSTRRNPRHSLIPRDSSERLLVVAGHFLHDQYRSRCAGGCKLLLTVPTDGLIVLSHHSVAKWRSLCRRAH